MTRARAVAARGGMTVLVGSRLREWRGWLEFRRGGRGRSWGGILWQASIDPKQRRAGRTGVRFQAVVMVDGETSSAGVGVRWMMS